jgi:hypothetical protein
MRNQISPRVILPALLIVLAILACGQNGSPTSVPDNGSSRETAETIEPTEEPSDEPTEEPTETLTEAPTPVPLGSVLPDEDVVKHGSADSALSQLHNREDLHDGDHLEIDEGGVANVLLDNGWDLLLFNKTRLGVELGEGETIQEAMVMQSGTLLGRRAIEECEEACDVVFPLPGGRSVRVYGTTFFIVLDDSTGEVIAGNFEGKVEVEGGGASLPLPPGTFIRDWAQNQSPNQATQGQITFTPQDFETWGYELEVPADFSEVVCNDDLTFVADITLPDGSEVEPGEDLTKVWEVLNDGTCTWTDDYKLVFERGDDLLGSADAALEEPVPPGESAAIAIELTAPEQPGRYQAWWQLANEDGETFGQTPYVSIVVVDKTPPPAPALLSPSTNYSDSANNACPPVTLTWREPSDFSGIADYQVEVWRQVGGSWELAATPNLSGTSTTYDPTFCDVDPTLYRWRVQATDRVGNQGDFSGYRAFSLYMEDTQAIPPILVSPAHNATFDGVETCPTVTMRWEGVSDPSGIDDYELNVDWWNGSDWELLFRIPLSNSTSYSYEPIFPWCDYGENYFRWQVRTHDNSGNVSTYSPARWFVLVKLHAGPD